MASEQFSLCWDNFHKNMSSGMNSMLENEDLVDVTLAVEGKYLKAHKMVLSVCSPYFKELFKSNPCKHPIVFMKDVSYVALSDLLQFMYQGEVQVSQENLSTFIKTAEALQIKGLTGDGSNATENDTDQEEKSIQHIVEETKSVPSVPRPKKLPPSQAVVQPPAKRQRTSTSSSEMAPSNVVTKTEPITNPPNEFVQFKMEPYDQSQTISIQDDDEQFGEGLEETVGDDTEDYSMMEGNEEEPQAGTSTEGTGEGQETVIHVRAGRKNPLLIQDDYMWRAHKKLADKTTWICRDYNKLECKCKARAVSSGRIFTITCDHDHSPIKPSYENTVPQTVILIRKIKEKRRKT
ncbi:modifier of mdg4-like isoform X12 [Harmonia axyridis]|uniref:modifier of mdg4-like isoform X12 n=1 Tax=Harmonia axyridis TaxID=115357 RepID=UPI001E2771EC|nr:modifier of mdg4-like isoform X12 [Harmonia axyridis]